MIRPTRLDPCPLCVSSVCTGCGRARNGRDRRIGFRCTRCGSRQSCDTPVIHYNRDTHDSHVAESRLDSEPGAPTETLLDLMALIRMIEPHIRRFRIMVRRSQYQATDSDGWKATVRTGNRDLAKIESTVRSWVADHPGGDRA